MPSWTAHSNSRVARLLSEMMSARRSARRSRAALVLALAVAAASASSGPAGAAKAAASASPGPAAAADAPARAHAAAAFSLSPGDIHAAYGIPKTGAPHQRIAIVSAFDDPDAEADLSAYSKRFGLPSCTAANGCFRKANQTGATSPLPVKDPTGGTWLTESSIGIELARGVCQSCSVMLVEANSFGKADLSAAVNAAALAGATVVVTTNNQGEAPGDPGYASDYAHPGTAVVGASGDAPYNGLVTFPATLPGVLAVGGTQLNLTPSDRYLGESAWSSTTSGCSLYNAAASWQAPLAKAAGCAGNRAVADVAAVASPGAIVHIQDLGAPCGATFCQAEGTSISAPIIGGMIGLAGSAGNREVQRLYEHSRAAPTSFRDIRSGTPSSSCHQQGICQARRGYDGPTGLGTPNGLAAFLSSGGALDARHPAITLPISRGRLPINGRWTAGVSLHNGNSFEITGTLRVAGRVGRHIYTFAAAKLSRAPLGSATTTLSIASRNRALLRRLRSLGATLELTARGAAGGTVTLRRGVRLVAP